MKFLLAILFLGICHQALSAISVWHGYDEHGRFVRAVGTPWGTASGPAVSTPWGTASGGGVSTPWGTGSGPAVSTPWGTASGGGRPYGYGGGGYGWGG